VEENVDLCKDVEAFPTIKRLEQTTTSNWNMKNNKEKHGWGFCDVWSSAKNFTPM